MNKVFKVLLILIVVSAIITLGIIGYKKASLNNMQSKAEELSTSRKYFKIQNIKLDENMEENPSNELFVDFEKKEVYLVEVSVEDGTKSYNVRKYPISDEDMEIYNSIKDYKEDFDQDLVSAGSLIRWIIGNNGFTREVVFLPGKTELIEKIEKFKSENIINTTTREEKPLTYETTL